MEDSCILLMKKETHYRSRSSQRLGRWRWGALLFLTLYLIRFAGGSASDWSHNCPNGCQCKWMGGKKTVECKEAGYTTIPKGLSDEVQVLDLRGNSINTLPKYVFRDAGLVNLNKIKLTHCGIERVDRYAFAELKILVELDLSENKIREIVMESFETNARLREIQLDSNPLATLYGTGFPLLSHFQKLSLRKCNLTTIPPRSFEKLVSLEQLDLSGNQVETLSVDLFQDLKKLKAISLDGNPWKCDCKLKSFRDWAVNSKRLQGQPTCAQPELLANFEWSQLLTSHFACAPEILTLQISGQAIDTYIVGDVGETIRLECLVKANPPAEVRWVKDNISMTNATASSQGKSYYVHISGNAERWVNLTIPNSHLADAGDYTCVGENKGGSIEKNITLNFEDVPSGAGVGMGMGKEGSGAQNLPWVWILLGVVSLVGLTFLLILVCYCSRRRRHPASPRPQNLKGIQQQEPLVRHETNEGQRDDAMIGSKEGMTPLLSPANKYPSTEADPDYPDLLDLPRRTQESPPGSITSRSTVADSTRLLPQQLNPAALYDPTRNALSLYGPLHNHPHILMGRPQSPYSGSVASFASEPPQAIIPPPHRPGYVTLPRRPRIPSWSPATKYPPRDSVTTPLSISPTGSAVTVGGTPFVKYDNLGPRTTADGSSRLSLNKLDHNGMSNGTHTPAYNSATLPSFRSPSARLGATPLPRPSPAPHFNFDPIQEVEGPPTPSNENFPPNYGLPMEPLNGGRLVSQTPEPINPTPTPPSSVGKKVPPTPPPKPTKKATTGDDGTEV